MVVRFHLEAHSVVQPLEITITRNSLNVSEENIHYGRP